MNLNGNGKLMKSEVDGKFVSYCLRSMNKDIVIGSVSSFGIVYKEVVSSGTYYDEYGQSCDDIEYFDFSICFVI